MNEAKPNIGLFAECEVFGARINAVLCRIGECTVAIGMLNLQNHSLKNLKNSTEFERRTTEFIEWAGVERLNIIVKNEAKNTQLLNIPNDFQDKQFIIGAEFNLNNNGFGKFLKKLIEIDELDLWVGATPKNGSFAVSLVSSKIETDLCIIENLNFALSKNGSEFICAAKGLFTLKLDSGHVKFMLGGYASNTSFMLTGASLPETKLYLTKSLFFSDLALAIGVNKSGMAFGMTGRITTEKLSIFAGFMISFPPPKINLLTTAITTVTGRLSLADIVSDIAEIKSDAVQFLDVIAISDFDLQSETKVNVEANDSLNINDFNSAVGSELAISSDYKITELGDEQYIVTDNMSMRHFRIANSKVSLNCQICICAIETKIGNNTFNPGFFTCGVLEIFGVKARFLFKIEKGESLIALVQVSPISIKVGSFTLFELTGSKKDFPIEPIEGGAAAGNLIKKPEKGKDLILYINVQKTSVSCYLSAYLNILGVFKADALVVIKDGKVHIDVSMSLWGFSLTIKVAANYGSFSNASFEFNIKFDTSGFLEMLKKAQDKLRSDAKAVSNSIESAQHKITDAQNSVLRLQNEIRNCDNNINRCKSDISRAKWYQIAKKIARAAEIVWWGAKKAGIYVAIGVAYAALEAAKKIIGAAGAIAGAVLNALATIMQYATQLLWIKSFELGVTASSNNYSVKSKLVLIVLGKEKNISKEIALGDPKSYVEGVLKENSDDIINKANKGETITRDAEPELEFMLDDDILKQCEDLNKNYLRYEQSIEFTDALDKFFIGAGESYIDAYGEENPNFREIAADFTNMRVEYEMDAAQNEMLFNEEFADSIDTVVDNLNENGMSRSLTPDVLDKMKNLQKYAKEGITRNRNRQSRASQEKAKVNLIGTYEKRIEKALKQNKNRAGARELSIEQSNENYADSLVKLLEDNFGDLEKDNPMNLMNNEDLAAAIYELRNMRNRTKEENTNSEDDDELL